MSAGHNDTFHHIRDWAYFELPAVFGIGEPVIDEHGRTIGRLLHLPEIAGLQLTKFMVLQSLAGLLVIVIFWGLARKTRKGAAVSGRWWNFWEMLAVFIRDEVVRPAIGTGHHDHTHVPGHEHDSGGIDDLGTDHGPYESIGTMERDTHAALTGHSVPSHGGCAVASVVHPADKYAPFVWTVFFYILFCNLLGAVPVLGAATGHISVTAALAGTTLAYVILSGMRAQGAVGFWKHIAPTMDIPGIIGPIVKVLIWVIEFVGLLIKHVVLAVRLFANIMAGHTAISVVLMFIAMAAQASFGTHATYGAWLWWTVTPASIFGQVFVGLLELMFAFIQAYVFSLLAALFIGMAVHPH